MRETMEVFPEKLKNIWSKVELRSAILVSLAIQIILILLAIYRKRSRSYLLSITIWVAYLSADSMAIFALGHVSDTEDETGSGKKNNNNNDLLGFWSPFLLLHLGGPDTITAFSLEDNELWRRHLLTLASQVILSLYSFIRCLTTIRLVAPACFVFLAGVIKYGERIWALRYASKDHFKEAQLAPTDDSPNYFNLVEKFYAYSSGGIPTKLELEQFDPEPELPLDTTEENISEEIVLAEAYRFFCTFQRLIVDLILSYDELRESQRFFFKRSSEQAFKVIGVELNFFYEVLYTKAVIVHSMRGYIFRITSFLSIILALLLFLFSTKKKGYDPSDIVISYILLGGALTIEAYAFSMMIFSDLTMVRLIHLGCHPLLVVFKRAFFFFHSPKKARWSNLIGQYNLIRFCIKDRSHTIWNTIMPIFKVKETWDKYYYTQFISVTPSLSDFICRELKEDVISCNDPSEYKHLYNHKGQWTLQKFGYSAVLGWSLEGEFDESILVWHLATDLCYHAEDPSRPARPAVASDLSKCISNYMLYLLVNLPGMMGAGIGDIRFKDTCDEVNYFIKEEEPDEAKASKTLLEKRSVLDIPVVKGKNKSVLYKASKLATQLQEIKSPEIEWKIISHVWVEMLSYAASHCSGYNHAQQLSSGGELLTIVWLLMAHLGIVEQYRVEDDNTKVKLVVQK